MWRVTRPDGCVLFLEDVVAGEKQDVKDFPTSVTELADLVLEAAAEPVELNDVESILYPGEDMLRGALVSFSRCG
jgi:ketopantoate hydroxymethyltransferase